MQMRSGRALEQRLVSLCTLELHLLHKQCILAERHVEGFCSTISRSQSLHLCSPNTGGQRNVGQFQGGDTSWGPPAAGGGSGRGNCFKCACPDVARQAWRWRH